MFTGIVEESGTVESIRQTSRSIELIVRINICGKGLKVGDSIAVNGCCLTVVKTTGQGRNTRIQLDVLQETWNVTNLQSVKKGSFVNLERSLPADGRLGGHFVTGHVDGTGKIKRWERSGQDYVLDIEAPSQVMRYVVHKGSVAVDGISLTVAKAFKKSFRIWIIPHTFEVTALCQRQAGDLVNLEADLLGKYIEKLLRK